MGEGEYHFHSIETPIGCNAVLISNIDYYVGFGLRNSMYFWARGSDLKGVKANIELPDKEDIEREVTIFYKDVACILLDYCAGFKYL